MLNITTSSSIKLNNHIFSMLRLKLLKSNIITKSIYHKNKYHFTHMPTSPGDNFMFFAYLCGTIGFFGGGTYGYCNAIYKNVNGVKTDCLLQTIEYSMYGAVVGAFWPLFAIERLCSLSYPKKTKD